MQIVDNFFQNRQKWAAVLFFGGFAARPQNKCRKSGKEKPRKCGAFLNRILSARTIF
jgi:hypothetical protein